MTNLKIELNEYLSRNEPQKNGVSVQLGLKSLGKLFKKPETEDNEDLLAGTQKYSQIEICPSLSRMQRIIGFCFCVCVSMLFFGLSFLYLPVIVLKSRKFALMFTVGSCAFLCSFSFLWGPISYMKHLFSFQRLPFTTIYFSSLLSTLYCAIWLHSTPLTAISAVVQVIALTWFVITYIPGGQTGMTFFKKLFSSTLCTVEIVFEHDRCSTYRDKFGIFCTWNHRIYFGQFSVGILLYQLTKNQLYKAKILVDSVLPPNCRKNDVVWTFGLSEPYNNLK